MTYTSHKLDVYDVDIHFATDIKAWTKLRAAGIPVPKRPPSCAGWVRFATWQPTDGLHVPVVILWVAVDAHRSPSDLVNTIAHEATHAAGDILEHIGHEGAGSDEPRAYLAGWLTSWMWDHTPAKSRRIENTAT